MRHYEAIRDDYEAVSTTEVIRTTERRFYQKWPEQCWLDA